MNRFWWPCALRHRFATAWLFGSLVWFPLRAWKFVSCGISCVGSGICDQLSLVHRSSTALLFLCVNFQPQQWDGPGPIWAFALQKEKLWTEAPTCSFFDSFSSLCLNAQTVKLSVVVRWPSVFLPRLKPDECFQSSTYICILERDQFFHPAYSILCIYSLMYLKIPNI
jgi:hypothetical protein